MPGTEYTVDKFNYIGAIGEESTIFWISKNNPINTIDDLKKAKGLKFVATSPQGMRAVNMLVAAYVLDLDAKLITGLQGGTDCDMAIIRGEATATAASSSSYNKGVKAGTHKGIFVIDTKRSAGAPDVPALTEVAKLPKDRQDLLELMCTFRPSKSFFAPPGISKEKLDFLRQAFNTIVKRSDFNDDVVKLWYQGVPVVDGKTLQQQAETARKSKKVWQDSFNRLFDKYKG